MASIYLTTGYTVDEENKIVTYACTGSSLEEISNWDEWVDYLDQNPGEIVCPDLEPGAGGWTREYTYS